MSDKTMFARALLERRDPSIPLLTAEINRILDAVGAKLGEFDVPVDPHRIEPGEHQPATRPKPDQDYIVTQDGTRLPKQEIPDGERGRHRRPSERPGRRT